MLEVRLGYSVAGSGKGGSHRKLVHPERPTVTFAYHDGDEIGPATVRSILTKQVGLTLEEAKEVVRNA